MDAGTVAVVVVAIVALVVLGILAILKGGRFSGRSRYGDEIEVTGAPDSDS